MLSLASPNSCGWLALKMFAIEPGTMVMMIDDRHP
jgi:hypothetical protein